MSRSSRSRQALANIILDQGNNPMKILGAVVSFVKVEATTSEEVEIENLASRALLALQGPAAVDALARLVPDCREMRFMQSAFWTIEGARCFVTRSGYTGEDGFEIYVKAARALQTWDRVFEAGAPALIRAIGLGARDTLRLEMGYCLYGNDIDENTNPLEAGLGWTVRLNKDGFIGKNALVAAQKAGLARSLVGLVLEGERIARHGAEVTHQGAKVGEVTSGSMGISVGKPVAMAYLRSDHARTGSKLEVRTRGQETPASVVGRPMYAGGSVRAPKPRRAT